MNELIEEYLRTRGIRYFRGHRDGEYFYLLDSASPAGRLRLDVHLAMYGAETVQISITPDRYYPAAQSDSLHRAVAHWNAGDHAAGALVQPSSDPALVGIAAGSRYRADEGRGFAAFVETAEAAAAELFGIIGGLARTDLREAG